MHVDLIDIYNFVKIFSINELAKSEAIMHGDYLGAEKDIEKISAQGSHKISATLFDVLTNKIAEANEGKFSFKEEITKMLDNIKELDPTYLVFATLANIGNSNSGANGAVNPAGETVVSDSAPSDI